MGWSNPDSELSKGGARSTRHWRRDVPGIHNDCAHLRNHLSALSGLRDSAVVPNGLDRLIKCSGLIPEVNYPLRFGYPSDSKIIPKSSHLLQHYEWRRDQVRLALDNTCFLLPLIIPFLCHDSNSTRSMHEFVQNTYRWGKCLQNTAAGH